jgi:hypothetical protein
MNTVDIATVSPYCEITGDLILNAAGVTSLSLPNLQKVGGAIKTMSAPNMVSVDLPVLTSVGNGVGIGGQVLDTVHLPMLTFAGGINETGGGVSLSGGPLSTVDLTSFQSGDVDIGGGPTSANLSLPNLTGGSLLVVVTTGAVSVPNYANPGNVIATGSSVDLGGLVTTNYLTVIVSSGDLSFPLLTSIAGDAFLSTSGAVSAANLASITGGMSLQKISGLSLPNLKTIGGIATLQGSTLATLDLPALTTIKATLDLGSTNCTVQNTGLTALNLPSLVSLNSQGPALTLNGGACVNPGFCCSGQCVGQVCSSNGTDLAIRVYANPVLPQCRANALAAQLQCGNAVVPLCGPLATGPCP